MLQENPYNLFSAWLAEAEKTEINDPNAMSVATMGADGYPDVRIVLLRHASEEKGFHFYTNYTSRKGHNLDFLPRACLNFHWKSLERQVRITGDIQKLSAEESDAYFASRHRASRIGAWASQQSQIMPNGYNDLLERNQMMEEKFVEKEVPRPDHWGGFTLKPHRIEFWQAGEYRLHKRFVFNISEDQKWEKNWLYP